MEMRMQQCDKWMNVSILSVEASHLVGGIQWDGKFFWRFLPLAAAGGFMTLLLIHGRFSFVLAYESNDEALRTFHDLFNSVSHFTNRNFQRKRTFLRLHFVFFIPRQLSESQSALARLSSIPKVSNCDGLICGSVQSDEKLFDFICRWDCGDDFWPPSARQLDQYNFSDLIKIHFENRAECCASLSKRKFRVEGRVFEVRLIKKFSRKAFRARKCNPKPELCGRSFCWSFESFLV